MGEGGLHEVFLVLLEIRNNTKNFVDVRGAVGVVKLQVLRAQPGPWAIHSVEWELVRGGSDAE